MTEVKSFGMLHKRHDRPQEQFHAHWRGPHAEHAVKLVPRMQRYVQNHRAPKALSGFKPPCDGAPEVWLASFEDALLLTQMPEYLDGAFIDEPNFMRVRSAGIMVHEHVIIDGPKIKKDDTPVKVLFFLKRNPALSAEQFRESWLAAETPLLKGDKHLMRFVKSTTVPETYVNGEALYDGAEELWWKNEADFKKDARSALSKTEREALLDLDATTGMFVDENRVVWPN